MTAGWGRRWDDCYYPWERERYLSVILVVDIMGRGAVIGEMAVLAGVPALQMLLQIPQLPPFGLTTESMQAIMAESPELSGSLWKTAGMRFAENLIGTKSPYNGWDQMRLRRWLMKEMYTAPADGESLTYGQDWISSCRKATARQEIQFLHLHFLILQRLFFGSAKVFIREYLNFEVIRNGGEGGIRTRGTLRYTAFPMLHDRPLCHLSTMEVNLMSITCAFVNDQKQLY